MYIKNLISAVFMVAALFSAPSHATVITSSADSALTGATVIDFDTQTLGSYTDLAIGDVTFSSAGTGTLDIENYANGGVYGTSGLDLSTQNAAGSFDINFGTAVSAFGMIWGAADVAWNMYLYDANNALIESIAVAAQVSPYIGYIGAGNNAGIARVELRAVEGFADWVKIDNFAYVVPSNVPEASILSMLGIGLLLTGFTRKRNAA